ncbi:MAG TPA: hypothetical protein VMU93_09270 [Caulobacteraceae bacterium]|nr:hypothetical protein [Caulobacteraceae bacterium]
MPRNRSGNQPGRPRWFNWPFALGAALSVVAWIAAGVTLAGWLLHRR